LFTNLDPTEMVVTDILKAPNKLHLFGTDHMGRDVFSRVLYGGRISLLVATVVTTATTITGVIIGAASAYYPRLDEPVMRVMDILMAFPSILLVIGIVAILGSKVSNVMIALIIPVTPRTARIVRGVFLSLKEQDFVMAARCTGAKDIRIMLRHLLPNAIPTLLVRQTYVFGISVLNEGAINYLGVGTEPGVPTLGSIVANGQQYLQVMPWIAIYGGAAIALLVLAVNIFGDGLRDVLDPRMRD
jgi:peptide/nickel transport system permease protein